MNKYLNSTERNLLLRIGGARGVMKNVIDYYTAAKKPNKTILYLARMADGMLRRLPDTRYSYLDAAVEEQLKIDGTKHDIVLRPKEMQKYDQAAVERANEITPVEREDFLDLAGWTIQYTCQVCTNAGKEVDACGLRKLWVKYHIAVFDETVTDTCPYQYEREGEK